MRRTIVCLKKHSPAVNGNWKIDGPYRRRRRRWTQGLSVVEEWTPVHQRRETARVPGPNQGTKRMFCFGPKNRTCLNSINFMRLIVATFGADKAIGIRPVNALLS